MTKFRHFLAGLVASLFIAGRSDAAVPPNDSVFLIPGAGFSAATLATNVGNPGDLGYSAKSIARWDVVPFQTVGPGEELRVGVVAFHGNGIDKVSFSANGGSWADSTDMALNPETDVVEYWVKLRADDFPIDGVVEIRAKVVPKTAGMPLVLGGPYQEALDKMPYMNGVYSLFVWTNKNGTLSRAPKYISAGGDDVTGDGTLLNPFKTMSKAAEKLQLQYGTVDGAKILCLPGSYDFNLKWGLQTATANNRFISIEAAPGVGRDQVILVKQSSPKVGRIRIKNVTLKTDASGNFFVFSGGSPRTILWLDGVYVSALNGRYTPNSNSVLMGSLSHYETGTKANPLIWFDVPDGPVGAVLIRNAAISQIKSDMISGTQSAFNVTGGDIDPANTGAHPDIYQIYRPTFDLYGNGTMYNHILYGVEAHNFKAQGIFIAALAPGETIHDSAFVNLLLDPIPTNFTTQINKRIDNVLWANNTVKQTFFLRAKPGDDNKFSGNLFSAVTLDLPKVSPAEAAVIHWEHNHFVSYPPTYGTYVFGTDITTGTPPVENWATGQFTPLANGILTHRLEPIFSTFDVGGYLRESPTSVGALEQHVNECTNGATKACSLQQGVCAGSMVTCTNGAWPVCGTGQYGVNFQLVETSCEGLDNDCDGLIDEPGVCAPPTPPGTISASAHPFAITVNLPASIGGITATSYQVYVAGGGSDPYWYDDYDIPLAPNFTIEGLLPNTAYTIKVKALGTNAIDSSEAESPYTAPVTITTLPPPVGTAYAVVMPNSAPITVSHVSGALLTIPAGAAATPMTASIGIDASFGAPSTLRGNVYSLGPEGATFTSPVMLSLPAVNVPGPPATLHTYNAGSGKWEAVAGAASNSSSVSGPLNHFSYYAPMISPEATGGSAVLESYAYPNPSRGQAVTFKMRTNGPATSGISTVYAASGEKISNCEMGSFIVQPDNSWVSQCRWSGEGAPSGVYFYVITARFPQAEKKVQGKIALLK